jgi:hypothetical protein
LGTLQQPCLTQSATSARKRIEIELRPETDPVILDHHSNGRRAVVKRDDHRARAGIFLNVVQPFAYDRQQHGLNCRLEL